MFYFTGTWLEKRNNDINDPFSLNHGGICDNGLSLNRYLHAHPGDTGKCPSKLTAYKSIVPTWYSKMYYVHICTCQWIFILYRSMVWVRVFVCVYRHVCVLMRIPSCIDILPCHLFVSYVLILPYMYTYWINYFWFLISRNHYITHTSHAAKLIMLQFINFNVHFQYSE